MNTKTHYRDGLNQFITSAIKVIAAQRMKGQDY